MPQCSGGLLSSLATFLYSESIGGWLVVVIDHNSGHGKQMEQHSVGRLAPYTTSAIEK